MIHFGGRLFALHLRDRIERGGFLTAGRAQRDGLQIIQRYDLVVFILHGQHVVVAGFGVYPVARRDHLVGGEGGDDVADHFLLSQAQFAGARAIDRELQRGVVEILRNEDVLHAGRQADLGRQFLRQSVAGGQTRSADLHVDGRGQTEVEHRIGETARLKIRTQLRKLPPDAAAHAVHVLIAAHLVMFGQADLDKGRVRRGVAGVNRRETGGDSDVGEDHVEVPRRNHFADEIFDFVDLQLRHFQARAGGGLQGDDELAGIRSREEGDLQPRIEQKADCEAGSEGQQQQNRPPQAEIERAAVDFGEAIQPPFEPVGR